MKAGFSLRETRFFLYLAAKQMTLFRREGKDLKVQILYQKRHNRKTVKKSIIPQKEH